MTRPILLSALLACALPIGANYIENEQTFAPIRAVSIYDLAESVTGAPAWILYGIACTESDERDDAVGDGGESIGRFQLRENYHAERAGKWFEYDPKNPGQAALIAGFIFMENLAAFGDVNLAIAAYRQGIAGVRKHGPTMWYVERVKEAAMRGKYPECEQCECLSIDGVCEADEDTRPEWCPCFHDELDAVEVVE